MAISGGASGEVTEVALWLRSGSAVLPTSSGVQVVDGKSPQGCPGGTAEGCAGVTQEVRGNVDFPSGLPTKPADGSASLPFRFFPVLDGSDLDSLRSTGAQLGVAITVGGVTVISYRSLVLSDAQPVLGATAQILNPAGGGAPAPVGDIPPGGQTNLVGALAVSTSDQSPDIVDVVMGVTGSVSAGAVSAQGRTQFAVVPGTPRPEGLATVTPSAVTLGAPTQVIVTARQPTGLLADAVSATLRTGTAVTPLGALVDDGLGDDLEAGDGIHTGSFTISAPVAGASSIEVSGNGFLAAAALEVLPAGVPIVPEPAVGETFEDPPGQQFVADRLTIYLASDGIDAAQAAATAVGGTVVGRVGGRTWQLGVPNLCSQAAFEALKPALAGVAGLVDAELIPVAATTSVQPNDPQRPQQWWLDKLRLPQAWAVSGPGAPSGTVAVLDTGADLGHPDLAGKLLNGRDFGNNDENEQDTQGHGTHVSGIVAARINNGTGVAGVGWNTRVLPVKVFPDGSSQASDGAIAAGIRWAVDRGARVINMSLGSSVRSRAQVEALEYAYRANVVVVAAAGNANTSARNYPAAYSRTERFCSWLIVCTDYTTDVIAVSATRIDDQKASYSNFGSWVDIAAPGGAGFSEGVCFEASATDVDCNPAGSPLSTYLKSPVDGAYEAISGTSMASPMVAAAASLVLQPRPSLSTQQVRDVLRSTARPLSNTALGPLLDVYEATFNGGFEHDGMDVWDRSGDTRSITRLGPIVPREGKRMGWIGTGSGSEASLSRGLSFANGTITDGKLTITFRYNYVTEEYPEYVGTAFNDYFNAFVITPSGTSIKFVDETVNTTAWTPVSGIDFPDGDSTVGQSGWKTAKVDIPAADLAGTGSFRLFITDVGDSAFDSVALIDDIELT